MNFVQKSPVSAYKYRLVSQQLPMHFYFAFYWNDDKKDVDINIDIAKEIKKDEYREIRNSMLQKLDLLFMKSLEDDDSNKKSKVIELKNKLRDVTKENLPDSWEQLLVYYPAIFSEVLIFLSQN